MATGGGHAGKRLLSWRSPGWSRQALRLAVGAVAVACAGAMLLWLVPLALTPRHGLTAAELLKARNDARAPVIGFAIAVGAAGTLWYTAKTYRITRDGQITDRYSAAVTQLGSKEPASELGGIYALERIARDSVGDRPMVLYVLGAFVRISTHETAGQAGPTEPVRAALAVGMRLLERIATDQPDTDVNFNLRRAHLEHMTFARGTSFARVLLEETHLEGADLRRALNATRAELEAKGAYVSVDTKCSVDAG